MRKPSNPTVEEPSNDTHVSSSPCELSILEGQSRKSTGRLNDEDECKNTENSILEGLKA